MTTDTSEKGLESLICEALTGQTCGPANAARERPSCLRRLPRCSSDYHSWWYKQWGQAKRGIHL